MPREARQPLSFRPLFSLGTRRCQASLFGPRATVPPMATAHGGSGLCGPRSQSSTVALKINNIGFQAMVRRKAPYTRRLRHLTPGVALRAGIHHVDREPPLFGTNGLGVLPIPVLVALAGCPNTLRTRRELPVASGREAVQAGVEGDRQASGHSPTRMRTMRLGRPAIRGGQASQVVPVTCPRRSRASRSRYIIWCRQRKPLERRRRRRLPIVHTVPPGRIKSCMLCTTAIEAFC